jgi:hypothetical protein
VWFTVLVISKAYSPSDRLSLFNPFSRNHLSSNCPLEDSRLEMEGSEDLHDPATEQALARDGTAPRSAAEMTCHFKLLTTSTLA